MKITQLKKILSKSNTGPSKWEYDNIIWGDRLNSPTVLLKFLTRIDLLNQRKASELSSEEKNELKILTELLDDIDETECNELLDQSEDTTKDSFIEDLARKSAIEVLTNSKLSIETMTTSCKLPPSDFILCAKRTQDIINSIHGLVIKGETLSNDVART